MRFCLSIIILFSLIIETCFGVLSPAVRIKDIISFEGIRGNQLVGYGIVVGLNGTGDGLNSSPYTQESLVSMLERIGVNIRNSAPSGKNVAAVMVTATLPAFARQGSKIDVTVSAIGDAKDLNGGTLLVTPLRGADGEVYAVSQGPVSVGGYSVQGAAASDTKGVPTAGRIANGAIIEKEINFKFNEMKTMNLSMRNPDFTTAKQIENVINTYAGKEIATVLDPMTIQVKFADRNPVQFITDIEKLTIHPDTPAKIVVDGRDGIVVMTSKVRLSEVAVAHGNITFLVKQSAAVSQPYGLSNGSTVTIPKTSIKVNEEKGQIGIVESGASLQDVVDGLQKLKAKPRDLIIILNSVKAAGALQADIEVIG
jgi:flagellar P-ring protein precursor FlgI